MLAAIYDIDWALAGTIAVGVLIALVIVGLIRVVFE